MPLSRLLVLLFIVAAVGCHPNPDRARMANADRQLDAVVAIMSTSPESAMYAHCIDYRNVIAHAEPVRTAASRASLARYAHLCSEEVPLAVLKKFVPVKDPKASCRTVENALVLLAPQAAAGQPQLVANARHDCVRPPAPKPSPAPKK